MYLGMFGFPKFNLGLFFAFLVSAQTTLFEAVGNYLAVARVVSRITNFTFRKNINSFQYITYTITEFLYRKIVVPCRDSSGLRGPKRLIKFGFEAKPTRPFINPWMSLESICIIIKNLYEENFNFPLI